MPRFKFKFSDSYPVVDSRIKGILDKPLDELYMVGGLSYPLSDHKLRLVIFGSDKKAAERFANQFNAGNSRIEDEDESTDDLILRRWVAKDDPDDEEALKNANILVYTHYYPSADMPAKPVTLKWKIDPVVPKGQTHIYIDSLWGNAREGDRGKLTVNVRNGKVRAGLYQDTEEVIEKINSAMQKLEEVHFGKDSGKNGDVILVPFGKIDALLSRFLVEEKKDIHDKYSFKLDELGDSNIVGQAVAVAITGIDNGKNKYKLSGEIEIAYA